MRFSSLPHRTILSFFLALAVILAACVPGADTQPNDAPPEPYFRPPAPAETSTPAAQSAEALPGGENSNIPAVGNQPTATCENNLTFLRDVTIPDGTKIPPLSTMDKRWEVENSGTCGWNQQYRLRLIAGPAMGAQPEQALFPARGGTRAVLRILFEAPDEPGDYRSAWQAVNPQGEPFGDPFFIDIVVEGTNETPSTVTAEGDASQGSETPTP